eukprot:2236630-Rhodomonas_salina.2
MVKASQLSVVCIDGQVVDLGGSSTFNLGVQGGSDPLKVVVPTLTLKRIEQATPLAGAHNTITVSLQTNLNLQASEQSKVVIGLAAEWRQVSSIGLDWYSGIPGGLAVAHDGHSVAISDSGDHTVNLFDALSGVVIASFGKAGTSGHRDGLRNNSLFSRPMGISFSSSTIIFIADRDNHAIRKIDLASWQVSTVAGRPGAAGREDGFALNATLNQPQGLTFVDNGRGELVLFIADSGNGMIRKLDIVAGMMSTLVGRTANVLNRPSDVVVLRSGRIFVADELGHRIREIDSDGIEVSTLAGFGQTGFSDGVGTFAFFSRPSGLALSVDQRTLMVADAGNHRIRSIDLDTRSVNTFAGSGSEAATDDISSGDGDATTASFISPKAIDFTPDGSRLLVLDSEVSRVRSIQPPSTLIQLDSIDLDTPGSSMNLFCDSSQQRNAGTWARNLGILELYVCDGKTINAESIYSLSFNLTNPVASSWSPVIRIRADGTANFQQSQMVEPGVLQSRYGVRGAADPIFVIIPKFLDRTIGQSSPVESFNNTLTVTLVTNVDLTEDVHITISGLSGARASRSLELQTSSLNLFCNPSTGEANSGSWDGFLFALTLRPCTNMVVAPDTEVIVSFDVQNPAEEQDSPEIVISAAGDDVVIATTPMIKDSRPLVGIAGGARPLFVVLPEFSLRGISQSSLLSNQTNFLTIRLLSNVDLEEESVITIS